MMSRLWKLKADLFFVLFCGLQFYLMYRYAVREVVPGSPLANDQVTYLFETYQAALTGQASGAWAGLVRLVSDAPAAGFGLQMAAYGVMLVEGIGRMSALGVNLAYFALVPGLLFLIVGRDKPLGVHLFVCGFWLSVQTMYGLVGSPFDFRLDFAGMALFTLVCALIWRTRAFTRPALCVLTGLAVIWLCLTRLIMVPHLVMMGGILVVGLLCLPSTRTSRATWTGIGITAAVTLAGVLPYLIFQSDRVWAYYVVGHVIGPEKDVRAQITGLTGWLDNLGFYPRELFRSQLGDTATRLLVRVLEGAALVMAADWLRARWLRRPAPGAAPVALFPRGAGWATPLPRGAGWAALVVAAAAVGPYITLTVNAQKSWVVANVFVVAAGGVALLAFLLIVQTLPRLIGGRPAAWATTGLGLLVLGTGLNFELKALAHPSVITGHRADFAARDQMLTLIKETSAANGWSSPYLFVDHIGELDGLQMQLSHFERYGSDLAVRRLLAQIFEVEPKLLWESLAVADFLILRDSSVALGGNYPFDHQMARLNGELHGFCQTHCRKLGSFTFFNIPLVLYSRVPGPA